MFEPRSLPLWVKSVNLLTNLIKGADTKDEECIHISLEGDIVTLSAFRVGLGLMQIKLPVINRSQENKVGYINGPALDDLVKATKSVIKSKGTLTIEMDNDTLSFTAKADDISFGKLTEGQYYEKPTLPQIEQWEMVVPPGGGLREVFTKVQVESGTEWPHFLVDKGEVIMGSRPKGAEMIISKEVSAEGTLRCPLRQAQIKILKELPEPITLYLGGNKRVGEYLVFIAEIANEISYRFYVPKLDDNYENPIKFVQGAPKLGSFCTHVDKLRESIKWQAHRDLMSVVWSYRENEGLLIKGVNEAFIKVDLEGCWEDCSFPVAATLVALGQMDNEVEVNLHKLVYGRDILLMLILSNGIQKALLIDVLSGKVQ